MSQIAAEIMATGHGKVLVAFLFFFALALFRRNWVLLWLGFLPITMVHELAHWIVAFILRLSPRFPNLIPQEVQPGCWVLGRVTCNDCSDGRAVFVALAPLLLAPAGWWAWQQADPQQYVLGLMALVAALPSCSDWRIAVTHPSGTLYWIAVVMILFTYYTAC